MTYFLSNKSDGCWFYRCYLPQLYGGFQGDKTSFGSKKLTGAESFEKAKQADIIVFQRPDERDRLEAAILLKKLGKKIVFENDDTYRGGDPMKFEKWDGSLQRKIENLDDFIRIADMVTTTTEFLADEYRKLNKNVVVIPNCIDPSVFPEPKRNTGDKVRIGLCGSTTLNGDFDPITDLLRELSDRPDVQLVMFGLPSKELQKGVIKDVYQEEIDYWGRLQIEHQPFVPIKDYFKTLNDLKLDLMLIPRKDNYFNRCKSNLKFLEASMCGVPVVAQGFKDGLSPYQGKEDQKHMFVVDGEGKWKAAIDMLIKDKTYRESMGENARKYVLAKYNIHNNFSAWRQAFKTL